MAVIGTFKLGKDGGWTGHVRTLTLDTRLRLVPNDDRDHDDAPAFRVLIGGSCIGDAWEHLDHCSLTTLGPNDIIGISEVIGVFDGWKSASP